MTRAKHVLNITLPDKPAEDLVRTFIRRLVKVAAEFGFECAIQLAQVNGKATLLCETKDFVHHLKLKLHFGGDRINPQENRYPLRGEQCRGEWIAAAKDLLRRNNICTKDYRVDAEPPQFVFNWLSHLLEFAEGVTTIGSRPTAEMPDLPGPVNLAGIDVSGQKPN